MLRFYGYFQESVVESNIENHRVRRVVLLYYLADDTLQVTEPKQDNSGIPQVSSGGSQLSLDSSYQGLQCCTVTLQTTAAGAQQQSVQPFWQQLE